MARRTVTVDGSDPIVLSESMIRGLQVIHRHDGRAHRSNMTSETLARVYWQATDQLRAAGLVMFTYAGSLGADRLALTPLGTRVVYALEDE